MKNTIQIGGKVIGAGNPTFVIAEIGSNHDQKLEQAKKLIAIAAEAGVNAVKFQLFSADALYSPGDNLYRIFKEIELNPSWVPSLKSCAESLGLAFLASAFDEKSIALMAELGVSAFKWASSETTNLKSLRLAACHRKPLIISTGMCDFADVYEAVKVCQAQGNKEIALLHCVALYPTRADQAHLRTMDTLREAFNLPVGFSDHTLGVSVSLAAVARGASLIEKHITLDRGLRGPDHFYAMEPAELKDFVRGIREVEQCLSGGAEVEMHAEERPIARRDGLQAKVEIEAGAIIIEEMIAIARPALGIRPRYKGAVIGSRAKRRIATGDPIVWEALE